jgi:hypothetical protein
MNESESGRVFNNSLALCRVLGGDLKERCLEMGMPEQVFDRLFKDFGRLPTLVDRHDLQGNLKYR